jgi:mannose-1-phosphate guanylyltransferase
MNRGTTMIYAVILAGGEESLLRQSIKRLDGFLPKDQIWIVTTETLSQDLRFHLRGLEKGMDQIGFILEPCGRNTAPAIGLAAITLNKISPDAIMIVMPSDHAILDTQTFQEKLRLGIRVAEKGYLVTFGIKPNRPETAYGYIQLGLALENSSEEIFHAERFLEKPDLRTAESCIASGNY